MGYKIVTLPIDITKLSSPNWHNQKSARYRCKSDIAIFAWRGTWKYANSPIKLNICIRDAITT